MRTTITEDMLIQYPVKGHTGDKAAYSYYRMTLKLIPVVILWEHFVPIVNKKRLVHHPFAQDKDLNSEQSDSFV